MMHPYVHVCLYLSFFLYFWRPNPITGLSGWWTPDEPLRTQETVLDRRRRGLPLFRADPRRLHNLVGKTQSVFCFTKHASTLFFFKFHGPSFFCVFQARCTVSFFFKFDIPVLFSFFWCFFFPNCIHRQVSFPKFDALSTWLFWFKQRGTVMKVFFKMDAPSACFSKYNTPT